MTRRSRGEGTIFRRKDGRWQASLQLHGVRKVVYGKTRQEAHRKLTELKRQAGGGNLPDPGRKTLNDLLDQWLETAAPTLKPRSLADYKQTCRLYLRPTLGKVRLDKLTPDSIQRLYNDLQARGLMRAALKVHVVLHRALKLAVLWRWLPENLADRVVRPQYRPERKPVWTPDELRTFLAGAREHWLYPLWAVAIVSGCRLGELLALTWEDVDNNTILVNKVLHRVNGEWLITPPKTRNSVRRVTLPAPGIDALHLQATQQAEWRARTGAEWNLSPLIFTQWNGNPLHGATVSHNLKCMCERLGIPHLTPHGLRHLHASLLLHAGLPAPVVSARLGHANPHITMTVYAHVIGNQNDVASADAIERALE